MKSKLLTNSIKFILLISVISACSSNNNLVKNNIIQKRRYTNGYYISNIFKRHHNTLVENLSKDSLIQKINQSDLFNEKPIESSKIEATNILTDIKNYQYNNSSKTIKIQSNESKLIEIKSIKNSTIKHNITRSTISKKTAAVVTKKNNENSFSQNYGLWSFLLGLIGLLFFPASIAAIILGIKGIKNPNQKVFAYFGLGLGIFSVFIYLLALVYFIAMIL